MAADDNYVRYCWVAILSMLMNKNKTTNYDFYILSPKPYSDGIAGAFERLRKRYVGTEFHFVMMGDLFNDERCAGQLLPAPTYYYLKIADIITKYDKAIYLDPDIIVLQDLSDLYNTDLGNNYVAGVKAAGYVKDLKYSKAINLKDISQYINANSLVFNLKEMRKDGITKKFMSYAQHKYRSMDQDVLNIVCYNKIRHIPFRYNLMTKYLPITGNKHYSKEFLVDIYGEKELIQANEEPVVIHYANVGSKPWNSRLPKDSYWWHYAWMSPWRYRFVFSFIKSVGLRCWKFFFEKCFSVDRQYVGNKKIKKYKIFCFHFTKTKIRRKHD